MVVLFVGVRFLEHRHVLSKLVTGDKIACQQMIDRVVYSGPADTIFFVFHMDVKRLHVEMVIHLVNFREYSKAFGRFAESIRL